MFKLLLLTIGSEAYRSMKQITIEWLLGVGKNTLHRAVFLRQHGLCFGVSLSIDSLFTKICAKRFFRSQWPLPFSS